MERTVLSNLTKLNEVKMKEVRPLLFKGLTDPLGLV